MKHKHNPRPRGIALLAAATILPLLLSGCASPKSSSSVPIITDDSASTWQNASATPPANTAVPTPPPNTLDPSTTTVGGSVSTRPAYAQYDIG